MGIEKDTLVVFTSDNGPEFITGGGRDKAGGTGGLRGAKRAIYEGGVRVPTIFQWVGTIPPGKNIILRFTRCACLNTLIKMLRVLEYTNKDVTRA